jgi:hypothetical protein
MNAQITAGDYTFTVVEDIVTKFEVIFVGSILDGISGDKLRATFSVSADRGDVICKPVDGGLFCIAADVQVAFPDLTVPGPPIRLTVRADGYRDQTRVIAFPANPTFPVTIASIVLRRLPIRLQGRVSQNTVAHPPIAGARIMTDAAGAQVVLLRAAVRSDYPIGTTVRARTLDPVVLPAPARTLAAAASSGQSTLVVNSRQGLASGQIIRFGPPQFGQFSRVQSVSTTPANLALPGEITVDVAPNRSFGSDTAVEVFTPGTSGTTRQLTRAADTGDGVLQLDGPLAAATIEIEDGPQPLEYQALGALTDADGYYSSDGIVGVAALDLKASATGFATPATPVSHVLDYNQTTNVVDFRL